MGKPESELVRLAVSGDKDALGELLEAHTPKLSRLLARRIPQRWRAVLSVEDVLQETFTDAFLGISRFDPRGDFGAWLRTIAKRNLVDGIRWLRAAKRGGGKQPMTQRSEEDSLAGLFDALMGGGSTPSQGAARREACAAVRRVLLQLPPLYRQVVQAIELQQQELSVFSKMLGRKPGAVCMLRERARSWMRWLLGGEGSAYLSTT